MMNSRIHTLARSHTRAVGVLVDELDAGRL
jgi:hypothetical protein